MDYRVDPKGKVFTTHITKRTLLVKMGAGQFVIQGTIHLMADNRLKDELNQGEPFIAVTNASVYFASSDSPLYETPALIVNKNNIDWIFPQEASTLPEEPSTQP